jgi:hypothetical protein
VKAYRVWVTFADGLEGFASFAFEKRDRADTICVDQTRKHPELARNGRLRMAFDVREEDVPWMYKPKYGEPFVVKAVMLGDDEEFTQITA